MLTMTERHFLLGDNPLRPVVLSILNNQERMLTLLELFELLTQQGDQCLEHIFADATDDLTLYRKNFLLMNALYQLQDELILDGINLSISSMAIGFFEHEHRDAARSLESAANNALRDYYLDWNNYTDTSDKDVAELLADFWQRYYSLDRLQQACHVLGLSEEADWNEIQTRYRQLVSRHHPDRGGQAGQFIAVREAFDILKIHRRHAAA